MPTVVGGLGLSILLAIWARAAARTWLDVPRALSTLRTGTLVVSVLIPVLGNSFGFFMAYRRPRARSLLLFLGPGVFLVGFGITVTILQLPASATAGSLVASVVVALIPAVVMVMLLLRLPHDPGAAYRRGGQ